MAKVNLAHLIDSIRGQIGHSVVYFPLGSRQFARNWVIPSNPSSEGQSTVRSALTAAANAFLSITVAEKQAWADLAANLPRKDLDSESYKLSAIQLYIEVNLYRQLDGQAITDVAPTLATPAFISPADASIEVVTDTEKADADATLIGVAGTPAATDLYALHLTFPTYLGSYTPKKTDLRYAVLDFETAIVAGSAITSASGFALTRLQQRFGAQWPDTVAQSDTWYVGARITPLTDEYLPAGQPVKTIDILPITITAA